MESIGMSTTKRPNILFICTDQQRYDALGCYGNPHIQTPTIDGLAAEGVLFEQCYVQSSVCAPSRASLVTGQYPHLHGLWGNGVSLPPNPAIFSRHLADSGYSCGMIGKMHLAACFGGRTEERLDDGYEFYCWAHDPTHKSPENDYHVWMKERYPDIFEDAFANGTRERHEPAAFDTIPTKAHYSRWASERTIEFLDGEREEDEPFFLWVNFFDPHHPFVAPEEYLDRYDPETVPDPVGFPGELATKPPIQQEASNASYAGHARGYTTYPPREIKEIIAAYYAMVTLIDDEVKRILDRLEVLGLSEDTIVIFTSDHGEMLGDHQLLLKGPLILRWPGQLPAGERRPELVQWIDLTSTFLDVAGVDPMPTAQGTSLMPLARGDADAEGRGWALCEYLNSGHPYDPPLYMTMLRTGDHKLIVQHGPPATTRDRTGELYNLAHDPAELINLWDEPAAAEIRIELERMLLDVLVSTANLSQPREAHW
jgi:arylsulfatase A-like enzyme